MRLIPKDRSRNHWHFLQSLTVGKEDGGYALRETECVHGSGVSRMERIFPSRIFRVLLAAGLGWSVEAVHAQIPISGIMASYNDLTYTNDNYTTTGGGANFPTGTRYDIRFNEGAQNNLILTGFEVGGEAFNFVMLADIINLERVNNVNATGTLHIVLFEDYSQTGTNVFLRPSYAATMMASLRGSTVNRGADNVFANTGDGNGNNNNIERIDYIFPDGFPVFNNIDQRGFLVMDRGGNDRFKIAAITALDGNNRPTAFGTPVSVLDSDWGNSGISIDTTVMQGYTENGGVLHPTAIVDPQPLSGVFVTWQALGLQTNDFIYGYALTGNDVSTNGADWTNVTNGAIFPTNTSAVSEYGGLDLISGGMMFFEDDLNVEIGDRVWDDWDGDGIQDGGEAGISNVLVQVYDSHTNLAAVARTDANGNWLARGIGPGTFLVHYALPAGYQFSPRYAGTNTAVDNNAETNTGWSGATVLGSGATNLTLDAGMHLTPGDLRLSKSVLPTDVKKGDTVVYTLSIANAGLEDVSLTQVTDVLPPAVAFGGYGATTGSYSDVTGIWDIGELAVGAAGTLTITGTVNSGYGGLTITNSAAITRMNRPDTNSTDNSDSATFAIQQTDLAVFKSVAPTNSEEGVPVAFTVALTNNGPREATGVEVSDLLPAGFSYAGSVPSQGSYASGTGIWTVGTLANGGSASLVVMAVPLAGTGGTTLTNTAAISASSHDDPVLTNNTASAVLPVLGADLGIGKRVDPATASEGQVVVYTIAITNFGPAAVTGVTASEPLMAGVTYASNGVSQGSYASGTGVWTVGALAVNGVATLTLYATVDAATAGTVLTNTSAITASSLPDPDPANDSDSATVTVSTLRLDKTSDVSGSVAPGGTITYTMIVTNYGATTHTNVSLADMVPDGTTYVPGSVAVTRYPENPPVPTTVVYDASATFTAPAGVTSVTVSAWGGGGGGGQARGNPSTGGGGAGGAFATATLAVTPSSGYTVTVGGGGAGGSAASINGIAGSASWFNAVGVLYAQGGAGGTGATANNSNGAGATGSSASSIGDTVYRGGNGSTGVYTVNTGYSGAGGGGAGSTGAGGNAAAGTGGTGTSLYGGTGANGVGNSTTGATGSVWGGGGSGGKANSFTDRNGGAGAAGRVTVAYDLPSSQPTGTSDAPPALAKGWELDPGQWLEVAFAVTVDDPLALMAITNTASVTSEFQTIPLTDTVVDPFIPVDLGVGKAADAAWVGVSDAVKFTITVTNLSMGAGATGVELTDLIPAGFNYVSNTASQGSYISGSGMWTVGSLASLATATLDIYSTAAAGSGGLVWTNTVDIAALDQTDLNPTNDTAQAVVGVYGADLALAKTVDRSAPNEGDALIYSIVITNQGPSDTTGVTVSEPLTNGVTYVSNAVSQGSYNSGSGIWTVGDLDAGESAKLWIAATVDAGTKGRSITNWSRITATDLPDPVAANDQDSATVYVSALIVTKVSDVMGYAIPGSNIVYTMVVSNSGASTHSNVVVTDLAPAGTTYVADSLEVTGPNWAAVNVRDEFNAQAYTNEDGTMDWNADWQENDPAGAAGPVGDYVGVTTGGGRLFLHWAYVGDERAWRAADLSGYASAVLRYDWQTVNLAGGQTVSVLVSTNGAAPFVEVGNYSGTSSGSEEIDITPFMSTNTTVRFENLSVNWDNGDYGYLDNVEMAAMTLTTNTVSGGGPPTLATNRTLRPGEVLTLTFEVAVDNPCGVTQIVNTVSVTSDQTSTNVTATVSDPVAYTDLALVKTVDGSHPAEGDRVAYTIVVTNKGPIGATGLQVVEPLTNGLTYVSDAPSQGTYDDATGLWNVGALAVGNTASLVITADVEAGTAGTSITNLSRVAAMDQADATPGDNEGTAVIAVAAVDVGVGKSVNPTVPVEKEQLVYTVSVTNFGPDTATGVVVADLLPGGLAYVSHVASQGTYDDGTGLWNVGTLAMSQVETLAITATVETNTVGTTITNIAMRVGTDQVDTNTSNDSASAVADPNQAPLDIFKSVNPAGTVGAGDTLTYTIVVTNVSNQTQTGIVVADALPAVMTYVPGSIAVTAPVTTNAAILDPFNIRNYGNNDGTTNWSANWVESEGDGPAAGNVQILFDTVRGATFTLRFAGPSQTMARQANLAGKSGATLSFDYRRDGLEAGEYVAVQMSSNGTAGTWTEIGRFNGAATDAAYANFSYDIGAWISTSTAVRFLSPAGMDATDILWIDDVQIETERRVLASVPGGAPPELAADLTLLPGETAVLTFDATVDTPAVVTQLVNSASVTSDQMTNPRTDTAENPVDPDWATLGSRIWFDANSDGIQDAGETNGIANVPVSLMTTNGVEVAATATSAEGLYGFTNVLPGIYYVRFDLSDVSTSVALSPAGQGGDDALDSDAIGGTTGDYAWTTDFAVSAGQTNLDLDLGLTPAKATRAELVEVWGEGDGAGPGRVVWRTSSEWNTAGFFVYRVDPETGTETRLNDALLPAAFQASGAVYELADPAATAGGAGTYRLSEVELTGAELDLGTHAVAFGPPPAAAKAARLEARAPKTAAVQLVVPKLAGPSGVLKATFRREGIYGVSLAAIAAGMGLVPEEAQALAAAGRLAFSQAGAAVPTIYDAARDRMLFHGRPTDDWYARDAAVMIRIGSGLAMPRREPAAAAGAGVFPATVRFEEDRYPFDSATTKPADFYYWDYVISGTNAAATRRFALDLTGAMGTVALKVRLQGWSSTTNDPDHLAEFLFNGAPAGSVAFDGQAVVEAELEIPVGAVQAGTNELAVKGTLQPGRTHSYFVVDRIDAAFRRELAPLPGTAHFRAGGAEAVSAAAFAEPVALALDETGNPTWIADESGALPDKAWAVVASSQERFAVAEADGVPLLEPEAVAEDPWFLAETNRIDYLVLTSRELEAAAQELADYRAGQGLRVGVATFEDACDWMTDGLRTPEAIPELLAFARATWTEAPWLVVLAGNGHYDYLNALNLEANHVPPLLVQTADGVFAGDALLADADADGVPDVALGRLPARTAAELAAMIAKIRAYEAGFGEAWQSELVLANDANDAAAGDFAAANAQLAALADAAHPVRERIDLNATALASARSKLLGHFRNGTGIVHYTGHGGVANWSSKGLLKAADVSGLTNASRPAAVLALSCLVGRYEAPGVDSLGELLLRKSGGGAVAVWGPSGLSRNDPATELGAAFYRAALQDGCGTLGGAILRARRSLPGDLFSADTLASYNLLGDPALRIVNNARGGRDASSFAEWRWERFRPDELSDLRTSGATDANFFDYAMGDDYDVEAELPEFGFALPETGGDDGFVLRWKRRVRRNDVEYRLFLSHDLEAWSDDPANLVEIGAAPDPDGVMETVRTRVKAIAAERTFLGIRAKKK